jgi:hypothetical protein
MFGEIAELVIELGFGLESLKEAMVEVAKDYRANTPKKSLHLYPWPAPKHPYALYWVRLSRKKIYEDQLQRAAERGRRRWVKRLKIRTAHDLDAAIYRHGLSKHRKVVHHFHDLVQILNRAHRTAARTLASAAKMLYSRAGGIHILLEVPPLPANYFEANLRHGGGRVLELAWRFGFILDFTTRRMKDLALQQAAERWSRRLRLVFTQDSDHPAGRLAWKDVGSQVTFTRLTKQMLRELRLLPEIRDLVDTWEGERRDVVRVLKSQTSLLRRLRQRLVSARELYRSSLNARNVPPPLLEA